MSLHEVWEQFNCAVPSSHSLWQFSFSHIDIEMTLRLQ